MSILQTLLALVVLIYVLCVIVQAIQDVLKSFLDTKAETLKQIITQFMGEHLTLPQVEGALQKRGLDITALDHFSQEDFRILLDGIKFEGTQLQGLVAKEQATLEEAKDHVAAAYEGARAKFRRVYAIKNKKFAVLISFVVVLILNANLIMIYEELAADQVMAQAIVGRAEKVDPAKCSANAKTQPSDLAATYAANRDCIKTTLKDYPVLVRWSKWCYDLGLKKDPNEQNALWQAVLRTVAGLAVMGLLVSLGAPFWNDVLKGLTGVNNALNTGGNKKSS